MKILSMQEIYQTKIIIYYKEKFLLLKKIKDIHIDHVGGWEVPGGKIKTNEDPIMGALREIKEEIGIECEIIDELKFLKLEKNNIKTNTYVYLAETKSEEVRLSDEHSEYIWTSYDNIDKLENIIYKDLLKGYILDSEKILKRGKKYQK